MKTIDLITRAKLNEADVVAIYQYGSRVYGTARKNSDYDFIVVLKNKASEQYSDSLVNINFFTPEEHQRRLNEHEISAIECFLLQPEYIWVEKQRFYFKLDVIQLRHALMAKSSNSWVKAKKKLTVPADYDLDLGRKSLFHSMRIIQYGIQLASTGTIVYDAPETLSLFHEIMNCYTWEEMFEKYKKEYNSLCTAFRKLAPKE